MRTLCVVETGKGNATVGKQKIFINNFNNTIMSGRHESRKRTPEVYLLLLYTYTQCFIFE